MLSQKLLRRIALIAAPVLLAGSAVAREAAAPAKFDAGMVSAADPRAAEAGAQMLRAGGQGIEGPHEEMVAQAIE